MKKFFILGMMLFLLAVVSCTKQDDIVTPVVKTGKMLLPQVSLVQGSELITKDADINSLDSLRYEFYVKGPNVGGNSGTWVLAEDGLYKDGSAAQVNNSPIWEVGYPNNCTTCFIEVPLNIATRVVVKGIKNHVTLYYGIFETAGWTLTNIGNVNINLFEANSRLLLDLSDVIKNTNFNFYFKFTGSVNPVDFNGIVNTTTPWQFNATRDYHTFGSLSPLSSGFSHVIEVNGKGIPNSTPEYKIDGVVTTITSTTPVIVLLGQQSSSNFKAEYSITRKDGVVVKSLSTVTSIQNTPTSGSGFSFMNWLQAGYNFNVKFLADPQQLGNGCFVGTLINNTTVNGTVTL